MAKLTTEPHEPHPHPDAPPEIAKDFDNFRKTFETGPHFNPDKVVKPDVSSGEQDAISGSSSVFDLPSRFWDTPSMRYSPMEMEAINVRGMTNAVWRRSLDGRVDDRWKALKDENQEREGGRGRERGGRTRPECKTIHSVATCQSNL